MQVTRIGKVTDTEERELDVIADSGNIRLDALGGIACFTVAEARKLRSLLFDAIGQAQQQENDHDPAGHVGDCTGEQPSGDCPACETGGPTSAWEHHYG
jgi:hypothetical protein